MAWRAGCDVRGAGYTAGLVLEAVCWRASDPGDKWLAQQSPRVEIPQGHAGHCHGVRDIAARARVDERTVRRVLHRLESAGVILRRRRYLRGGPTGRRAADLILINLDRARHCLIPAAIAQARARAGRAARAIQLGLRRVAGRRQSPDQPPAAPAPPPAPSWPAPPPLPERPTWYPLKRLTGAAYRQLYEDTVRALIDRGDLPPDWATHLPDAHWERIRAAMLRDLDA